MWRCLTETVADAIGSWMHSDAVSVSSGQVVKLWVWSLTTGLQLQCLVIGLKSWYQSPTHHLSQPPTPGLYPVLGRHRYKKGGVQFHPITYINQYQFWRVLFCCSYEKYFICLKRLSKLWKKCAVLQNDISVQGLLTRAVVNHFIMLYLLLQTLLFRWPRGTANIAVFRCETNPVDTTSRGQTV